MFLEKQKEEIERKFIAICEKNSNIMDVIREKTERLNADLQLALKYIYSSVLLADIAETDFEVFLDYAVNSVMLWYKFERVRELPTELFLEYVVNPSVSCEEIDICRTAFYSLFLKYMETEDKFWNKESAVHYEDLSGYLDKITVERIADEVNFWCAGEASLEERKDTRMFSAKTVFASAGGNREELAVYYIQALRSVGIPARIAETDVTYENDNHMWVEVYISGEWHRKAVCAPWAYVSNDDISNEAEQKMIEARKARGQGHHFIKKKHWKNEEREKFFFGDIFTMNIRAKLLKSMSEKDQIDIKCEVLEEHFAEGYVRESGLEEEFLVKYVLNPRIFDEVLRPWRKMIKNMFSEDEMEAFRRNPLQIRAVIGERFGYISSEELGKEYVPPTASIMLERVSEVSAKILFVAIARTAFIPARFDRENMFAQYWNGEKFCNV